MGDSIRRRRGAPPPDAPDGERPLRWPRLLGAGLLGALAAFGAGYAIAVFLLFPAPADAAPGIVVPRLLGQDSAWAVRALASRGLRLGTVTALPDPAAVPGMIVAQDALGGQELRRGAFVNVAVSSGAARAVLPDVAGYAVGRAVALLGALGFEATQQVAPADVPAGRVVAISPAPGVEYELPAQVVITVSSGPPPPDSTAVRDSTATDSLVAPAPDTTGGSPRR